MGLSEREEQEREQKHWEALNANLEKQEDLDRLVKDLAGKQEEYPRARIVSSFFGEKVFSPNGGAFNSLSREITIPADYVTKPALKKALDDTLLHELGHYYLRHDLSPQPSNFFGPETKEGVIQEMEAALWAAHKRGFMEERDKDDVETIWNFGGFEAFEGDFLAFVRAFEEANERVARTLGVSTKLPGFQKSLSWLRNHSPFSEETLTKLRERRAQR